MILLRICLALLWACGWATALPQTASSPSSSCSSATKCLDITPLPPRFFKDLQSQRQAITYGPFAVPASSENHGMKEFRFPIATPCSDCFVTHVQADLQHYPDGSYANADTGMWLHHVVVTNLNRTAAVCPRNAENVFASGNERTPADICLGGSQRAGYYIAPGSVFYLTTELMNDHPQPRDAAVVIDWEWVPAASTAGGGGGGQFRHATPLWLDITGACPSSGSEVPVPAGGSSPVFSLSMTPPWKATFSADTILLIMNHLHDGGETLQIMSNGQTVCAGIAGYGETAGYISGGAGGGHDHGHGGHGAVGGLVKREVMTHISSISSCDLGQLRAQGQSTLQAGDEWSVRANYNLTWHKAMGEGPELAPIMGISIVYVVKNQD